MHVHHLVGKWNEETCIEFWEKVAERFQAPTIKYRFNVCADGNKQNPKAFQTIFPSLAVNFGKVKKIKKQQRYGIGMTFLCIFTNHISSHSEKIFTAKRNV